MSEILLYLALVLILIPPMGACRNVDSKGADTAPVILTRSRLPLGFLRRSYESVLTTSAHNGSSLLWSISLGVLPPGLHLDQVRGEIRGTPTQAGAFSFTITSTVDGQITASKTFHLDIFDERLDDYGGLAEKPSPHGKTGFFRLEEAGNRWLFVDPLGNYFFPLFIEDMDFYDGGDTYKNALAAKYTGGRWSSQTWDLFTQQMVRRARSWGFNAIGVLASNYTLPIVTYSSDGPNSEKMPFVDMIRPALYGVRDGGVQDLIFGSDPAIYNGWRGASFPDVYSPLFSHAIQDQITSDAHALGTAVDHTPWLIGEGMDDLDYLFGWRNSTNSPHTGWLTAITSPVQTYSAWPWYPAIRTLHTDTQVYTKTAWSSFLQRRYGSIQKLNATWKSNYTTFGSSGVPVREEIVGAGDGSRKVFSKALARSTAAPHSVAVFESGKMVAGDDGLGRVRSPADTVVGSVNYTRGFLSVTFKTAPPTGAVITVNYWYGGWPKRICAGTGLLDEDGSSRWIGEDFLALSDTDFAVKADMEAFLKQQLDTYFSEMSSAIRGWLPHHLLAGPGGLSPMARPIVFQEAGKYIDYLDVGVDDSDVQAAGGLSRALLNVYSHLQKPIEASLTVTSQEDSPWSTFHRSSDDYPNQRARGETYASKLGTILGLEDSDGVHFVVDFDFFAWTDKRAESANFGLVSSLDNAYDGTEDQTNIGYDPWGFKTGGEGRNFGDFIDLVESANVDAIRKVASEISVSKSK
ncbi:MAG TPA: Ig domain-containing protein [Candidatus Cybelea sp.]|nr:Ig domain-containing protein [Candidatus Cybelea sp.]